MHAPAPAPLSPPVLRREVEPPVLRREVEPPVLRREVEPPVLRREVEPPLASYQRPGFYFGLAALLLSLLIVLDAALWVDAGRAPSSRRPAARAAGLAATRRPCRERTHAARPAAADRETDVVRDEFRRQMARQLEHPYAEAVELTPR